MSFTNPSAFWLLLLIPIFLFVGWPRLAHRRRRDLSSLIVRLVLVVLLILGLAGAQIHKAADKLGVVFLLDFSDSTLETRAAAVEFVRDAVEEMGNNDQAAVVVFGADAYVEKSMADQIELPEIRSIPSGLNTDLAEAMRLALALFPADTAKRMVVLSDGKQTVGNAEEVARLADATNVQVDYVYLGDPVEESAEVLVMALDVPGTVSEGQRFFPTVTLASSQPDRVADLSLLVAGNVVYREEIQLQQGEHTYPLLDENGDQFSLILNEPGFVDLRVVVEPHGADNFSQNNQLSAFTEVTGTPRVLLVTTDPREVEALQNVLEETGLVVDVQDPHDLPIGLAPLSSYDSIVLANVSATDLNEDRMRYLQSYVRDLGGGLVVIGGPSSYGVGGYYQTPLEETLPVEMRLKDKRRIPKMTMLFVIDRSGSMEIASPSGVSNLELAKEAIVRSFDLLNEDDRAGVLSFDVSAYWVLELQDIGDDVHRREMQGIVGSLRPGGGTNIREAVLAADYVFRKDESDLIHIILLTDGGADESGIPEAIDRMHQNYGITTSVVAIGTDYARWLENAAAAGHGKFHLAYDVSTIPAIFTAETMMATRSYIVEADEIKGQAGFVPAITAPQSPLITQFSSVPPVRGYIATTPKETAAVILTAGPTLMLDDSIVSREELDLDPLLASWQYGLGRAVAFTSDATSRWASDWVDWAGYADFWTQTILWTITQNDSANIESQVVQRGEEAVLTVDVRDNQGDYANGLQLDAAIVTTGLETTTLQLRQTAPGRYEAPFKPDAEGAYFITVAGGTPENADVLTPLHVSSHSGWVLSYSAEYRVDMNQQRQNAGLNLLQQLARVAHGSSLRENPADVFAHNLKQEQAATPIWPWFVLAALLLLPFDVAVRRLVLTKRDLQKMRQAIPGLASRQPALETAEAGRMGRLMDAKSRARSTQTTQQEISAPRAAPKPVETKEKATTRRPSTVTPSSKTADGSLAAKLLERKRSAHDEDDGGK